MNEWMNEWMKKYIARLTDYKCIHNLLRLAENLNYNKTDEQEMTVGPGVS